MQNNKGLSDVVSTVLIILLVVAAIAIIGAIVLNVVNNTGVKVNNAIECQTTTVVPVSCVNNLSGNVANGTYMLTGVATGASVSKVTVYFADASGVTLNSSAGAVPVVNGQQAVTNVLNGKNASKMSVAVTLTGMDSACPVSTPINCA